MQELHVFTRNPKTRIRPYAFTADRLGSNLPGGPWHYFKFTTAQEGMIGFAKGEADKIRAEVEESGYSIME